jgi:hypothetical protein
MDLGSAAATEELRRCVKQSIISRTSLTAVQELRVLKLASRVVLFTPITLRSSSLVIITAQLLLEIWLDPDRDGQPVPLGPVLEFINELARENATESASARVRDSLRWPGYESPPRQAPKRQRANTSGESRARPGGEYSASPNPSNASLYYSLSPNSSADGGSITDEESVEDPFTPPKYDPNRKVTEVSADAFHETSPKSNSNPNLLSREIRLLPISIT